MNDLRQLLLENAATEPPDHLDLAMVMQVGGRRRRRRRTLAVGAAAAATAAVVALGTSLSTGTPAAGPGPATDGVTGPVLTLDDAVPAVEGVDFRVLATRQQDGRDDERLVGVTDDGLGVVVRPGSADGNATPVGLVDPADGSTRWLPGGSQRIEQTGALALGQDRLVFRQRVWPDQELAIRVFDRASETWSTMRWPGLPRAQVMQLAAYGDRVYVTLSTRPGDALDDLWSVSLTDSADVRDEQGTVAGELDVTGDELTWDAGATGAAARVHVRDLATGEERVVDPHLSDGCGVISLERVGDRLLLAQVCDGRFDRLQVVTMDGDRAFTLDDDGVGSRIGDGGQVAVVSGGQGGPFVLDPVTATLWRVGDRTSLGNGQRPVPDGSALTLWTTTDWVPTGTTDRPDEPTADDEHTTTDHLVEWLS